MPVELRIGYVDQLSLLEISELIEKHSKCLYLREIMDIKQKKAIIEAASQP